MFTTGCARYRRRRRRGCSREWRGEDATTVFVGQATNGGRRRGYVTLGSASLVICLGFVLVLGTKGLVGGHEGFRGVLILL